MTESFKCRFFALHTNKKYLNIHKITNIEHHTTNNVEIRLLKKFHAVSPILESCYKP